MRFTPIAVLGLLFCSYSVLGQNNAPHLYLFNQAASPFSASVAESGLLSPAAYDPLSQPLTIADSGSPLRLSGGLALPKNGNTRLSLFATKLIKNKLSISVGYSAQNLGYKESTLTTNEPNGIRSKAFAFNILYKLNSLTLQLGGNAFGYDQDQTIHEKGFYSSFGASYSIIPGLQAGLQMRGIPFGSSTQTVQYTEVLNGQTVATERKNGIGLPTQLEIPIAYQILNQQRLNLFIEANGGYLLAHTPTNTNKLSAGGMARVGYKPFFVQGGLVTSGFTDGNFKSKYGVGAGVELKDFSVIYSFSTNQVYKNIQTHSLGLAITIGS